MKSYPHHEAGRSQLDIITESSGRYHSIIQDRLCQLLSAQYRVQENIATGKVKANPTWVDKLGDFFSTLINGLSFPGAAIVAKGLSLFFSYLSQTFRRRGKESVTETLGHSFSAIQRGNSRSDRSMVERISHTLSRQYERPIVAMAEYDVGVDARHESKARAVEQYCDTIVSRIVSKLQSIVIAFNIQHDQVQRDKAAIEEHIITSGGEIIENLYKQRMRVSEFPEHYARIAQNEGALLKKELLEPAHSLFPFLSHLRLSLPHFSLFSDSSTQPPRDASTRTTSPTATSHNSPNRSQAIIDVACQTEESGLDNTTRIKPALILDVGCQTDDPLPTEPPPHRKSYVEQLLSRQPDLHHVGRE